MNDVLTTETVGMYEYVRTYLQQKVNSQLFSNTRESRYLRAHRSCRGIRPYGIFFLEIGDYRNLY